MKIKVGLIGGLMFTTIASVMLCACGNNTGDIKSTKVTLYGKTFDLPVAGNELLDNGWSVPSNISYTKEFQPEKITYVAGLEFKHTEGGVIAPEGICNTDSFSKELKDCQILGFSIENFDNNIKAFLDENAVVFPCGITANSSYDDIVSAYGEPDNNNVKFKSANVQNGSSYKTLSYNNQITSGASYSFSFDNEKNTLSEMKIEAQSPFKKIMNHNNCC